MDDFLSMSDEDFLQTSEPSYAKTHTETHTETNETPHQTETSLSLTQTQPTSSTNLSVGSTDVNNAEQQATPSNTLDELYQPFKANGRDFQVRSLEEARKLMQMGVNYTQKMQQLAPNLRYIKTLEKEGLLSDEKLNYLIDLSKNNPNAIAKLVKESEIDTYNLEQEQEYTPNNYQVSEQLMHLDSVLDSIEHTPTYNRCIDVVGNQWDLSSRQSLASRPELIAQLNQQMQAGIYDQIASEVDRMRVFGAFAGISDFEAYRQVGAEMFNKGLLQGQPPPESRPQTQNTPIPAPTPVAKTTAHLPLSDPRIAQRAAAASPTEMKHRATPRPTQSILAMSDEEFLQHYSNR